tara:strand:+ start:295 stop:522 length:228 start_codon:yes stop_codon:yes gene_type:complete
MTAPLSVEFILEAGSIDQIEDVGLRWQRYGSSLVKVTQELPEELIESLSNDELVEFIGIGSEFLVYLNIREFSHR